MVVRKGSVYSFPEVSIFSWGVWGIDHEDCEFSPSATVKSYQKGSSRNYLVLTHIICVNDSTLHSPTSLIGV